MVCQLRLAVHVHMNASNATNCLWKNVHGMLIFWNIQGNDRLSVGYATKCNSFLNKPFHFPDFDHYFGALCLLFTLGRNYLQVQITGRSKTSCGDSSFAQRKWVYDEIDLIVILPSYFQTDPLECNFALLFGQLNEILCVIHVERHTRTSCIYPIIIRLHTRMNDCLNVIFVVWSKI